MKKVDFINKYGIDAYNDYLKKQREYMRNKLKTDPKYKEKQIEYHKENREKILAQQKEYESKNRSQISQRFKVWYNNNKEYISENSKRYYAENRDDRLEYQKNYRKQYYKTLHGRAMNLYNTYRLNDINRGLGENDLTPDFITDNILSFQCIYCGETDFNKLGCDRVDNTLPHTKNNVVPCCANCNRLRHTKPFSDFYISSIK